jgi:alpha/beta superfamily hydrolase
MLGAGDATTDRRLRGANVAGDRVTTDDGVELHAELARAEGDPVGGAVVCHPHPQHGGTSRSWLVPLVRDVLVEAGWTVLTFDFRGAGRSAGAFGEGIGEQRDVAAAVDSLVEAIGTNLPLLLGGWSFGAAVSLRHALDDERVTAWFGIALPAGRDDIPAIGDDELAGCDRRLLFVHGAQDEVAPLDTPRALADAAPQGELVVVDDADHFFQKGAGELRRIIRDFAGTVIGDADA